MGETGGWQRWAGGRGVEIVRRNLLRPATNILERRGPSRLWALPRFNNNSSAFQSVYLCVSVCVYVCEWRLSSVAVGLRVKRRVAQVAQARK